MVNIVFTQKSDVVLTSLFLLNNYSIIVQECTFIGHYCTIKAINVQLRAFLPSLSEVIALNVHLSLFLPKISV